MSYYFLRNSYKSILLINLTMEFVDTKKAAKILQVTPRRVVYLLQQRRIKGAYKSGKAWAIPLYRGKPRVSRGTRGPTPRWVKIRPRDLTTIQVNRNQIASNYKNNEFKPVISVNKENKNTSGYEAKIKGPL